MARGNRARRTAAVVMGGLALVIASAGVASAAPGPKPAPPQAPAARQRAAAAVGVQYVAGDTLPVAPGDGATASARCPAGTKAIGGGEYNSSLGGVRLTSSGPSWGADYWTVTVRNVSAAASTFRAYVVCASGLTGYQQSWGASTNARPNDTAAGYAGCPAGTSIISGGVFNSARGALVMTTAFPESRGSERGFWVSYVANTDTVDHPFHAIAVCATGFTRLEYVGGPERVLAPGQTASMSASCPAGTSVLGGSASLRSNPLTDSYPSSATSWTIWTTNTTNTGYPLSAVAICGT